MTEQPNPVDEVLMARADMNIARAASDRSAANYRNTVRRVVDTWRSNGVPLRKCAERIGITEGALRELLRAEGAPRRQRKKRATVKPAVDNGGWTTEEQSA